MASQPTDEPRSLARIFSFFIPFPNIAFLKSIHEASTATAPALPRRISRVGPSCSVEVYHFADKTKVCYKDVGSRWIRRRPRVRTDPRSPLPLF